MGQLLEAVGEPAHQVGAAEGRRLVAEQLAPEPLQLGRGRARQGRHLGGGAGGHARGSPLLNRSAHTLRSGGQSSRTCSAVTATCWSLRRSRRMPAARISATSPMRAVGVGGSERRSRALMVLTAATSLAFRSPGERNRSTTPASARMRPASSARAARDTVAGSTMAEIRAAPCPWSRRCWPTPTRRLCTPTERCCRGTDPRAGRRPHRRRCPDLASSSRRRRLRAAQPSRRRELEMDFLARLRSGELPATGIEAPERINSRRLPIPAKLWWRLKLGLPPNPRPASQPRAERPALPSCKSLVRRGDRGDLAPPTSGEMVPSCPRRLGPKSAMPAIEAEMRARAARGELAATAQQSSAHLLEKWTRRSLSARIIARSC